VRFFSPSPRHETSVEFTVVYERVTYRTPRLSTVACIIASKPGEPYELSITVVEHTDQGETYTMRMWDDDTPRDRGADAPAPIVEESPQAQTQFR
jgi:hypothetical protein